tara:strand:+ start:58514 stop:58621 length:108 start_codon:yes stop_codon:yes gene_type:complete
MDLLTFKHFPMLAACQQPAAIIASGDALAQTDQFP